MTTKIRRFEEGDRQAWQRLWGGYLAFYQTSLPAEITDNVWERLMASESIYAFAAEVDGQPIGFVHYLFHPVTWSAVSRCYLEDLYVDGSSRGTGAGRLLIESVYAEADKAGADQVYWLTEENNVEAQRLYDRVARKTPFIKYQRG